MRALLSRGKRPTLGTLNGASRSPTSIPVRKTTFPIPRRQLTFCDAFTILLAPVLTTAFVFEITRKERRIQAWDKKIAEIEAATEALRQRETEAWSRLQTRSVHQGLSHQRRLYSTATPAAVRWVDEADEDCEEGEGDEDDLKSEAEANIGRPPVYPSEEELQTQREWSRLLSLRLALHLLINIRTTVSSQSELPEISTLNAAYPDSTDELIARARQVRLLMRKMHRNKMTLELYGIGHHSEDRKAIDMHLEKLSDAFRMGRLSLRDLVFGYANAVCTANDSPSTFSLQNLMFSLDTRNQLRMAQTVERTIWSGIQILSSPQIGRLLQFYGKHKDIQKIDTLLKRLIDPTAFPRSSCAWKTIKACGMNLPLPITGHSTDHQMMLERLVDARLRCNQRKIAEVYTTLLYDRWFSSRVNLTVNKSFMRHDAEFGNWQEGRRWLRKTKIDAACAVYYGVSEEGLSGVIFQMLDLCVSCDRPQEYQNILDAAVKAEICIPDYSRRAIKKFKPRTVDIRQDWQERQMALQGDLRPCHAEALDKAIYFQAILAEQDPSLKQYVGITDPVQLDNLEQLELDHFHRNRRRLGNDLIEPLRFIEKHIFGRSVTAGEQISASSAETVAAKRERRASEVVTSNTRKDEAEIMQSITSLDEADCKTQNSEEYPFGHMYRLEMPVLTGRAVKTKKGKPMLQTRDSAVEEPETLLEEAANEEDEGYCSDSVSDQVDSSVATYPSLLVQSDMAATHMPPPTAASTTADWSNIFQPNQCRYAVE